MRRALSFLGAVLVLTLIACGSGDIGEDCNHEGHARGECVSEAVCGKREGPSAGLLVCLKQCSSPADCGAGETCGAIGYTTLRGCRAIAP